MKHTSKLLALFVGATLTSAILPLPSRAAEKTAPAPTTEKAEPTKGKKAKGPKKAIGPSKEETKIANLEKIAGKPLNEAQKQAVAKADTDFEAALKALTAARDTAYAQTLGLTLEQFTAASTEAKNAAVEKMKKEKKDAQERAKTIPADPQDD